MIRIISIKYLVIFFLHACKKKSNFANSFNIN